MFGEPIEPNDSPPRFSAPESPRIPLFGIVFLGVCWLLFLALIAIQFLSLGLIPVLAPVLVTLILGQVGLLQRAHHYADGWRVARPLRTTAAETTSARPRSEPTYTSCRNAEGLSAAR
jgi:hypothetical protein